MFFVKNWKLDSDEREFSEVTERLGPFFSMFKIKEKDSEAVKTESSKTGEDEDVAEIPEPGGEIVHSNFGVGGSNAAPITL